MSIQLSEYLYTIYFTLFAQCLYVSWCCCIHVCMVSQMVRENATTAIDHHLL